MRSSLLFAFLAAAPAPLTFDAGKAGKAPAGFAFTTSKKAPAAKWVLVRDGKGMVLAQTETKTKDRYASAVLDRAPVKDVRIAARIKTLGGYQGAGVVWGYKDADNYFVARTNPDEGNVRVDKVVGGNRTKLGSKDVTGLKTGAWHTFEASHKGSTIVLSLAGQKVVEVTNAPPAEDGKVGLWIKDDTVAHFDDLDVEALTP